VKLRSRIHRSIHTVLYSNWRRSTQLIKHRNSITILLFNQRTAGLDMTRLVVMHYLATNVACLSLGEKVNAEEIKMIVGPPVKLLLAFASSVQPLRD
jgi:hypothetical protein